jgi:putative nucleotidyltransferase with HDIG domain
MTRQSMTRLVALASTVALSWGVLTVGIADESAGGPVIGEQATREYVARSTNDVVDVAATEQARALAAEAEPAILVRDQALEEVAYDNLSGIVEAVRTETRPLPATLEAVPSTTSTVVTTTTTVADESTTTLEEPEEVALGTIEGFVFVDVNGDSAFDGEDVPEGGWTTDRPWQGVDVVAVAEAGEQYVGTSAADGTFTIEVPQGSYMVILDAADSDYPDDFISSTETFSQEIDCLTETCEALPVGLTAEFRPIEQVIDRVGSQSALLADSAWTTLAEYGQRDVYRELYGMVPLLDTISVAAQDRLAGYFRPGISADMLEEVRADARNDVTSVQIDNVVDQVARDVVNQLVTVVVTANEVLDVSATNEAKLAAAALVPDVSQTFFEGITIIAPPEEFTQLTLDAVNATGANVERTVRLAAIGGVLAVLVAVLGFYLARFRKIYWDRPRMVTLFGMLIVLGAGAVRLASEFQESSSIFVLPAVAFGYLAAVLFDNRMGTLMALAMGVLALVGTGDPGMGVYATLATLAPIGFVSSVSTRRAFRNSVLVSAIAAAVIAASVSWFFEAEVGQSPFTQVWQDAAWAAAIAMLASLVALAAMPFFESMFDITTTLRLLELTDRNHEALQLLQEKAFGSFNHSLMVGTLADAAARAIGANNLLARAAAYYHDIGKTENPLFFIENQFGISNPHDEMAPEESARVIRQHVLDGVELARRYNIPSEVAEGIVSHHGDGIMRFFYEKARQTHGGDNVNPDDFRHAGHKPLSREMAILMMADAVEGACRAVFAEEEPKPESIAKVVNRVVDEKVGDDQLSECDLTLGELSTVRRAFIDALTGHYHQRIPYPNFPGS